MKVEKNLKQFKAQCEKNKRKPNCGDCELEEDCDREEWWDNEGCSSFKPKIFTSALDVLKRKNVRH